jgi:hypothetical protein
VTTHGSTTIARVAVRIKPLTPVTGAEIEGIDLDQPADDDAFTLTHGALIQQQVIVFRFCLRADCLAVASRRPSDTRPAVSPKRRLRPSMPAAGGVFPT